MKKILIIGKDSYIGESIFKWLNLYPDKYNCSIVSPINYQWKKVDFTQYEIAINLAGIAHKNIKKHLLMIAMILIYRIILILNIVL